MDYFWSPNKGLREGKKKKRKKKRKRKIKLRYGLLYGYMTFVWNCRDFSMIFVHELLGYDC